MNRKRTRPTQSLPTYTAPTWPTWRRAPKARKRGLLTAVVDVVADTADRVAYALDPRVK